MSAVLLLGAGFAGLAGAVPPNMSLAEYFQRKKAIAVETGAARLACAIHASVTHDRCLAEATGREHVARADLEVAYRSTPRTRFEAAEARADARFWVDREECDGLAQDRYDPCLRAAKVAHAATRNDAVARMKAEETAVTMDALCADDAALRKPRSQACRARNAPKPTVK